MNELTADQINKIMDTLNSASGAAVEHYANWYFINAVAFLAAGILLCVACFVLSKHAIRGIKDDIDSPYWSNATLVYFWLAVATGFIGFLFVACNITNLFEPTAYAVHQLISDVRG